jgi:hypothetical protein
VSAVAYLPLSRRASFPVGPTVGLGFVGAAAAMTVALPLLTYTTSLALFGIGHVLSELHYIDRRFSARLGAGILVRFGIPISVAVGGLAAGMLGLLPSRFAGTIELGAAAALVLSVLRLMRRHRVAGTGIGLLLAAGGLAAPFQLLLALAILHNLTPLGLFAEALSGAARRRALALLTVPLIVLPLLIATGLPFEVLARAGLVVPEATFLASGPLTLNLGAYVPVGLITTDWALHAFTASVFAQIMHYTVVIVLLPRLLDEVPSCTFLPWPPAGRVIAGIAVAAIGFILLFVLDYRLARQFYALAALTHSWVEIPILLLAWGGFAAAQPAKA